MAKKVLLVSFAIIFILFSPRTSFATSGECSYHGGVDCSAGPSISGNAQCNDGWISSVLYSETDECQSDDFNPYSVCGSSIPQMLCSTSTLQSYQNLLNQSIQSCETLNARIGSSAICSNSSLTSEIQTCQQDIQTYQQWEQSYNSCIATAKNYMTAEYQAALAASCDSQHYISGNQCLALPANAHSNSSGGYQCNTGYQNSNGVCVPPLNSFVVNGIDLCNIGYIANPYHQCVPAQTLPATTSNFESLPSSTAAASPTSSAPVKTSFVVNANLQAGSSGSSVINLQKFLESRGFLTLPSGTTEGYFGSLTKQALITYQASVGLPATGYCGPMTRSAISNSQ